MSSPTFFPEGSTPKANDPRWRILQKILGATIDGGGGAGADPMTTASGAPVAAGTAASPFYFDTATGFFYVWDGSAWNIH